MITANKALIAEHGPVLFQAAHEAGASLYFEASVGGGMPAIKTIREALVGNDVVSITTIINGTCNYILTQMAAHGWDFAQALDEAQRQGYAEADPALDVEGRDAGHKVAIMASLVHGGYVPYDKLSIEGITRITPEDIAVARELGYCIKLLGIIRRDHQDHEVDVRVHPAMLHQDHILASVSGVFNAVLLEGDAVGPILLYGRGAGEMPTASAVVSDIVDVARNLQSGTPLRIPMDYYAHDNALRLKPLDTLESRYYLRFSVEDEPGVLAAIATAFGRHRISIASVMQKEINNPDFVPVIFLTHDAVEKAVRDAVAEVERLPFVRRPDAGDPDRGLTAYFFSGLPSEASSGSTTAVSPALRSTTPRASLETRPGSEARTTTCPANASRRSTLPLASDSPAPISFPPSSTVIDTASIGSPASSTTKTSSTAVSFASSAAIARTCSATTFTGGSEAPIAAARPQHGPCRPRHHDICATHASRPPFSRLRRLSGHGECLPSGVPQLFERVDQQPAHARQDIEAGQA